MIGKIFYGIIHLFEHLDQEIMKIKKKKNYTYNRMHLPTFTADFKPVPILKMYFIAFPYFLRNFKRALTFY